MTCPFPFAGRARNPIRSGERTSASACGLLLVGVLALGAPSLAAQSAGQILEQALERHEERLGGVEDLTLRQEVLGHPTTTHMVKEIVEGRPVLRTRSDNMGDAGTDAEDLGADFWGDPGRMYDEWGDRWSLEGQTTVAGVSAWRLSLTDFDGLDVPGSVPGQDLPFEPTRMVLELDEARLVPLTMTMQGESVQDGERRPAEIFIQFTDYREVEGYLHPFLTVIESDMAAAGMSEEELGEARTGLEELRRQLEEVPEAQREMMERMMGSQMEALEEMLGGDTFRLEVQVTDLQVNTGPPSAR